MPVVNSVMLQYIHNTRVGNQIFIRNIGKMFVKIFVTPLSSIVLGIYKSLFPCSVSEIFEKVRLEFN